jgi:hypothetical protein
LRHTLRAALFRLLLPGFLFPPPRLCSCLSSCYPLFGVGPSLPGSFAAAKGYGRVSFARTRGK